MNAFYEHHQDNIRFGYRCFDRILLNGLIQPFQQPERVIGFFHTYRHQDPGSRKVLRDIADQFQGWVKNRSQKWDVPLLVPLLALQDMQQRAMFSSVTRLASFTMCSQVGRRPRD
jgi:hypothetical protein